MKIDWLSENHVREWLDFNMKRSHITNGELADKLHYEESTVARHRAQRSANKIKNSTEFIRACTKVFEKDSELADCSILLNLDYLHDSNEMPFYEDDKTRTEKAKAEKIKFVQEMFRFLTQFKELQIYECNYFVRYFDVFYYLDRRDWAFLCMWTVLNDKGRNLVQEISEKMNQSTVKNDSYIPQLQSYKDMKLNMRRMKYIFRKDLEHYQINTAASSKKSESIEESQTQQEGLSKNVLLESMLSKFIGSKDAPTNVRRYEIETFRENMRYYLTMDDNDWNWLITLNSLSIKDRNRLQDIIYDLTAKGEYLTDEVAALLKEEPDLFN